MNIHSYIGLGRSLEKLAALPNQRGGNCQFPLWRSGRPVQYAGGRPIESSELAKYGGQPVYVAGKIWYDDVFEKYSPASGAILPAMRQHRDDLPLSRPYGGIVQQRAMERNVRNL